MIALYGNSKQGDNLAKLGRLFDMIEERGKEIVVYHRFADYLTEQQLWRPSMKSARVLPPEVTMLISLGGDGTFLRTAAWAKGREIPVMGINTGHLGYLAGFTLSRFDEIERALDGAYDISPRITLQVKSTELPEDFDTYALNEISVVKGDTTSMVDIQAYLNGTYLANYLADGVVVSTPTGSTAYNLSCGGPILQPGIGDMVITPIAPHSLTLRPLVLGEDSILRLEVSTRGSECHIGVDGKTFAVPNGTVLIITKSQRRVFVAQPKGTDFIGVLRDKLRWGQR